MSTAQLPHRIDPASWADRGMRLSLDLAASVFPRLQQALQTEARVQLELFWLRDPRRHAVFELRMQGHWPVQCQRCMETMDLVVDESVRLHLLQAEADVSRLDENEDYVVLDEQGELDLPEVVEDELLLCLPLVAKHEHCDEAMPLVSAEAPVVEEKKRPFAGLADLRNALQRDQDREV